MRTCPSNHLICAPLSTAFTLSLNSSQAATFDAIQQYNGSVAVDSINNKSVIRRIAQQDNTSNGYYSARNE